MMKNNEVQYNFVGQQINRSYKLPSYESQQKTDNSDIEQESPLKDQFNKNNLRKEQYKKTKIGQITTPIQNDTQNENIARSQLQGESHNKVNNLHKQDSQTSNDIYINEFDPIYMQQTPQQMSSSQIQSPTPKSQIYNKMNSSKKQELERIQENDDEKIQQSLQHSQTLQKKNDNQLQQNGNKTLKEIDGQLKEVVNTCRFKDLQNLLEESKNQLKNDVQDIINGLENDQLLIQSKINNLQDVYDNMKIQKSQNQQVDETQFILIENNLQRQINYLQSLRNGLQQSQNQINKPFQRLDDNKQNNEQSNQQAIHMAKSSKTEEIKSNTQLNQEGDQIYKIENPKINNNHPIKNQYKQNDIKILQNTEDFQQLDELSQFDSKPKNINQVNRYNTRGKIASALPKLEKNRYIINEQNKQEQISQKEHIDNRKQKEYRMNFDQEEKKLNDLKASHTDIHRRSDSRNRQQELKQLKTESSTMNSRSKNCISSMNHNDPRISHEIQDKEMLMQNLDNKKQFSQTIRGIFHSRSNNRVLSNSPENKYSKNKNNSQMETENDKNRLKVNKTAQNIKETKIIPNNLVKKRMNNNSVIESRNRGSSQTPDGYQNELNQSKRLDYSFNQQTPHKEAFLEHHINNHKVNLGINQNNLQQTRQFSSQQSDYSTQNNQNKNYTQSQNGNMNMSQALTKVSQQTNRHKRSYFNNINSDPFEETQNSYLHNQCSWKAKIDYMDQVKQKYRLKSSPENWKLIANDEYIDTDIKIEKLKQFSKMLSLKARRKIQLSRVKQKNQNLFEADELIINSIKAKLAIIETVNKEYDGQISEQGESLEQSLQNLEQFSKMI